MTGLLPMLVPLALGFLAVYWLLPRARPYPAVWGATAGGLAILLGGWLLVGLGAFSGETVLFYAFSGIAVLSGGLLVTQRNPARAALSFALVVLSTCGLFLLLAAPFLMAATTIIYAGAIVVTFLFVIMLAQQEGRSDADQRSREPLLSTMAGFVLLGALLVLLQSSYGATTQLDRLQVLTRRAVEFRNRLEVLDRDRMAPERSSEIGKVVSEVGPWLDQFEEWTDHLPADASRIQQEVHQPAEGVIVLRDAIISTRPALAAVQNRPGPPDVQSLKKSLQALHAAAARLENTPSFLHPREQEPLSEFSGPAPKRWGATLRRDESGRPAMPAENVAFLGRALFTDYLIPVEMAGTVLLVATIGAIAIATRRKEEVQA